MAGRGPAPDPDRLRRRTPVRGDWQPSPDGGWQHELPAPPSGISPAAQVVWRGWFTAWWAGHWTPDEVPSLRFVIRLWDRVDRGDMKRAGELRQWMDGYGLTPKGQMDRRWRRPDPPRPKTQQERLRDEAAAKRGDGRYDHLRGERVKDRFTRIVDDTGRPGTGSRFRTIPPEQRGRRVTDPV